MAQEMGVKFLGNVPIDVKFGVLIEGTTVHGSDSDEEDGGGAEEKAKEPEPEPVDNRPLVERYSKECWSYPRFEEFAKTLISGIEATESR